MEFVGLDGGAVDLFLPLVGHEDLQLSVAGRPQVAAANPSPLAFPDAVLFTVLRGDPGSGGLPAVWQLLVIDSKRSRAVCCNVG